MIQGASRQVSIDFRMPGRAHLVGAGGCGMRSLAALLEGLGWQTSGSDLSPHAAAGWPGSRPLRLGHHADHVPYDTQWLIASDAVDPQNPELDHARRRGIPACSYFECLGALTACRRALAVAGTHGKSTISAMLAAVLAGAGLDPSWCFGAVPVGLPSHSPHESGGHAGRGDLLVAEACEYREHFLHLRPWMGVLTGIEPDHFDYYRSAAALDAAFAALVARANADGRWFVRHECTRARRAAAAARSPVETFGLDAAADWSARNRSHRRGRFRYTAFHRGEARAEVQLAVPGEHQVLNSLAALALADACGVAPEVAAGVLGRFAGVRRRLEWLGTWRGAGVLDDYAHHPTELAATLATVRLTHPYARLWCVFQPHQASRTVALLDELAAVMHNAETVLIAEIYRARERAADLPGVSAASLARAARAVGATVADDHTFDAILAHLEREVRAGDVVLFAGAGDIGQRARSLVRSGTAGD